jgi:hypothetical protein
VVVEPVVAPVSVELELEPVAPDSELVVPDSELPSVSVLAVVSAVVDASGPVDVSGGSHALGSG